METLIKADIFFFITTIVVVLVAIVFVIVGYYFIRTLRNIRDITEKVKNMAEVAEEDFEHMREQVASIPLVGSFFVKKPEARKKKVTK